MENNLDKLVDAGVNFNLNKKTLEERVKKKILPLLTTKAWTKYQRESFLYYYMPAFRSSLDRKKMSTICLDLIQETMKWKCLPFHYFRYGLYDTGTKRERYIPDTIFYDEIMPHFNSDNVVLDDKILFDQICQANSLPKPKTHAFYKNGRYLQPNGIEVSHEQFDHIITNTGDKKIILKHANYGHGGEGVFVFESNGEQGAYASTLGNLDSDLLKGSHNDWIIQEFCNNHNEISRVFDKSFNTLRILTLLVDNEVHTLGAVMKFGVGNNQTDNASGGGVYSLVGNDGRLNKFAYDQHLNTYESHPNSGIKFEDIILPKYEQVKKVVADASKVFDKTRIIGWDIGIRESGPVIIEGNSSPGIALIQRPQKGFEQEVLKRLLHI